MKKLRGTVIIAASVALVAAGVLAAAGSAGTTGIAPGNLAFAGVDPSDGMLDIYVAKSDGTAQSNITNDASIHKDSSPVWSPEGRRIVFTRQTADRAGSNIMLVNADGSGLVKLTSSPAATTASNNIDPSWSSNGKRVVFASNRDGNYDLYWLQPGSSQVHRLTKTSAPVQNVHPSWSPNGKAIVFSRRGNSATTPTAAELFLLKTATGQTGRLTSTTRGLGDRGPVFSPTGAEIAFYSDRKGNNDVYVLHLSGNRVEQLTTWASSETEPSYAPDGSALVFVSTHSGATELWEQNLAGLALTSNPIQITSDKRFKSHPSWGRSAPTPIPTATNS